MFLLSLIFSVGRFELLCRGEKGGAVRESRLTVKGKGASLFRGREASGGLSRR